MPEIHWFTSGSRKNEYNLCAFLWAIKSFLHSKSCLQAQSILLQLVDSGNMCTDSSCTQLWQQEVKGSIILYRTIILAYISLHEATCMCAII